MRFAVLFVALVVLSISPNPTYALASDYQDIKLSIEENDRILRQASEIDARILRKAEECNIGLYLPASKKTALESSYSKKTYRACMDFIVRYHGRLNGGMDSAIAAAKRQAEILNKTSVDTFEYPGMAALASISLSAYEEERISSLNRMVDIAASSEEWMVAAGGKFPELEAEFISRLNQ